MPKLSFLTTFNTPRTSTRNTLVVSSDPIDQQYEKTKNLKEVTVQEGRGIVEDIVNNIFDEKTGIYDCSSSECASIQIKSYASSDHRLKRWRHALEDRKQLEYKIQRRTGKPSQNLLFNNVDNRDKQMVQRLLDYAQRMDPVALEEKKISVLREYFDPEKCKCVYELQETLPKPEQDGNVSVEVIGLPSIMKEELIGQLQVTEHKQNEKSKWLNSSVLTDHISQRRHDIEQVIEFYPDIDNLQVVGTNSAYIISHSTSKTKFLTKEYMCNISSDTAQTSDEDNTHIGQISAKAGLKIESTLPKVAIPIVALKINNHIFDKEDRHNSINAVWDVHFQAEPFKREEKCALCIRNIGSKLVSFSWLYGDYYEKNPTINRSHDKCFIFNQRNFVLPPGCSHVITIMFQPRRVRLVKELWNLRIFPQIFCGKRSYLRLRLHGKCIAPLEYRDLIDKRRNMVLDKSNKKIMNKLACHQASLAPLIQPHEVICPYERIFDEREIFNAQNRGYKCSRFDDLEMLKKFYNRLKVPRESPWDLRLDSIRKVILRLTDVKERETYFSEFRLLINDLLCCNESDLLNKFEHNAERDRSRFIYVRGVIGNGIEEWENLAKMLEINAMKLELQRFNAHIAKHTKDTIVEEEEEHLKNVPLKPWLLRLQKENPEAYVLRNLRKLKPYRDSMFIMTYIHLCDLGENIVSVIESTEYV